MKDHIEPLRKFVNANAELGVGLVDYLDVSLNPPTQQDVSQLHTFCQQLVEEIAMQTAEHQDMTPPSDGESVSAFFDFLRARGFIKHEELDYMLSAQLLFSGPSPEGVTQDRWHTYAATVLLQQAEMVAEKYTHWKAGQFKEFV